jgi:hypothetical protein
MVTTRENLAVNTQKIKRKESSILPHIVIKLQGKIAREGERKKNNYNHGTISKMTRV